MIRHSFCILDGIGREKERRLWREGILTWDDFLGADRLAIISDDRKRLCDQSLFHFQEQYRSRNASFFGRTVRQREHWRLFEAFRDQTVCLDIETNGLPASGGGYVTVVGLFNGRDYRSYLRGRDLTTESLNRELREYRYLITFSGLTFDVPFLKRALPGIELPLLHFDLCLGARRLKITGGLKKIEYDFGIRRDDEVQGIDGYAAVKLWEQARAGSIAALDLLVQYNREDTVNLMHLAPRLYDLLRKSTGIEDYLVDAAA